MIICLREWRERHRQARRYIYVCDDCLIYVGPEVTAATVNDGRIWVRDTFKGILYMPREA